MRGNDRKAVLDGCQNPWGCGKIAVGTFRVAAEGGEPSEYHLCAHCVGDLREADPVQVEEV